MLSSEFSDGAIALGKTLKQYANLNYHPQMQASYGGWNVPPPLTPDDPASFFPEISKDPNKTILVARFNDGLLVIFTCQSCGLQQMKEIESISGDKKEVTDAIFAWVHSLTDAFPKCSSVCEVLEAIAK